MSSNPYQELERGKGLCVAEWLMSQNVDEVISRKTLKQKGPEYVLDNAGVAIKQKDAKTMEQISLPQ